ncbi:MAG: tol-pal system-associated acyl-CoA thioesterase [Halieaceae bacterium]|jgi:tol-pal system-associated acyl-CoA thioesterase|nr:tol-pal system-associated acyl-CoA thioesterase [Halieaceae bacterium]
MVQEFSLPVRVYIEDTDAGGIVYYVNYLKFFERARTELMRTLGQDKAAVRDDGLMYVVSEASVRYRSPARLDDMLQVTARVTELGAATLTFQQAVWREGAELASGEVRVACVDGASGKPRRLDATLRQRLMAAASNESVNESSNGDQT